MIKSSTTILLSLALALLAASHAQPDRYVLEGALHPEGIALSEDGSTFYVGSTGNGTIYRADIASGEVTVLVEGAAPTALGLEVDDQGRLWAAGGTTGQVFVYDAATGELLRTYDTAETEATFLNDLVFSAGHMYVTDSLRPVLFRIGAGEELGELESWLSFEGAPFDFGPESDADGLVVTAAGFKANGIVVSPDGSALVIAHRAEGELARVDLETQEVTRVERSGEPLTAADGLFLDGDTLYVVRNALGQIDPLRLSPSGDAAGPAGEPITSELFAFPTATVVADGNLLVVNSQFDRRATGDPQLPFDVARVELPQD